MAKVVYVAGPYRSDSAWGVELNVRKAETIGLQIWHMGAVAMVPHCLTRFYQGAGPDEMWLAGTMELLRRCDAVLLIEGWEQSKGSVAEADEAVKLGIKVFTTMGKLKEWLEA